MKQNWLRAYNPGIRRYQEGGAMPPPGPEMGPPPGGPEGGAPPGGDVEAMLMEYAQTRDPELAVAICDMLVEMLGAAGGPPPGGEEMGGPPPPGGPEMGGPPPMARRGMKMRRGPVFRK